MSTEETTRHRRERSAKYPGASLSEALELVRFVDERGLDTLSAPEIAAAAGYKNVKTNTFSARLSSARQFGLLSLRDEHYTLTPLARSILHPTDPNDLANLRRQAFLSSPLYSDLSNRLADKRVPDPTILANLLYHHHQITSSAKAPAAQAFLESARFAGLLGEDGTFRPDGSSPPPAPVTEPPASAPVRAPKPPAVRIDLRLWGDDDGKVIRVRCPESITPASFERLMQAFRLHVRIEAATKVDEG